MKKILSMVAFILSFCVPFSASADLKESDYKRAAEFMDAKAGSFAKGMTNNIPGDGARKDELLRALGAYQSVVIKGLDDDNEVVVKASEGTIAEVTRWADIIRETNGVMQMRPFWEQASEVLMSRLVLEEALDANVPQK